MHDIQNISRKLDSKMEVSGAVVRSAFIQGPLENLAEAWHTRPEIVLPTSGGFKQSLVFRCDAAFDGHPLDCVSVVLNGSAGSHTFYKDHLENWPVELVYDPRRETSYSYYCDLTFDNVPRKGLSPVRQISREQAYADLVPSESYFYRRFNLLAAEEFPWDMIKYVSITSKFTPNALTPSTLRLTPTKRTAEIEFFSLSRQALDDLVFVVSYVPMDGSPIDREMLASGSTVFLNPFRKRIVKFLVSESFNWPQSNEIKIAFKKSMGMLVSPKLATTTIKRGDPPITFTTWYTDKNDNNLSYRISPPTDSPWKEAKSTIVKINSPAANDQTDGEQAAMERTLL